MTGSHKISECFTSQYRTQKQLLQTCCFGYFGHAWLGTPKLMISICRKFLCLSAGKKSISCFSGDASKICKLILSNLGMSGYTRPKLQYQLVEDLDVYLHAKNKFHHSLLSLRYYILKNPVILLADSIWAHNWRPRVLWDMGLVLKYQ